VLEAAWNGLCTVVWECFKWGAVFTVALCLLLVPFIVKADKGG